MCADVTSPDMKFPNDSMDLIFSNWLLMYLSDKEVSIYLISEGTSLEQYTLRVTVKVIHVGTTIIVLCQTKTGNQ